MAHARQGRQAHGRARGGATLGGATHARHRPRREDMLAGMLAAHQDISKRAERSDGVDADLVRALGVEGVVEDDD